MTKIDIISGFLGAGKTTLLKKLVTEALGKSNIVIIENEFGEIGIDGGFLEGEGIQVKEMNSGCICCSLVGDFSTSLKEVFQTYNPDRIIIEPSGVGKLSDIIKAIEELNIEETIALNSVVTVVDITKYKMYSKNFGEFYLNQILNAKTIILSKVEKVSAEKIQQAIAFLRTHNHTAEIITTNWNEIDGKNILHAMEHSDDFEKQLLNTMKQNHKHTCERNHEDHDHTCECNHEDHDHSCGCGEHHAEEIFMSWGIETAFSYQQDELRAKLIKLEEHNIYGDILRCKGMLPSEKGNWLHFDYTPDEIDIRVGKPHIIGKICVIGSKLKMENLEKLFAKI